LSVNERYNIDGGYIGVFTSGIILSFKCWLLCWKKMSQFQLI